MQRLPGLTVLEKVVKMIMTMIKDPECKFLHPSGSTEASASEKRMPHRTDQPTKSDILAEFPKDMLTNEIQNNISNILEHIENLHV